MNSNHRQGRRSDMTAIAVIVIAVVVMFAGASVPVQAQTSPVAFPAPTTFLSAPVLDTNSSTVAVATGDFNGDGKLDTVNVDSGSRLNVMLGKGDGTFQAPITLNIAAANFFSDAIAVGDFNGDHLLDVAVWATNSTTGNSEVHIYLGNGAGSLTFNGDVFRAQQQ